MILDRIFNSTSTLADPSDELLASMMGPASASGVVVNRDTALRVSAVFACVKVLAESVAQLPLFLYEKTSDGHQKAANHPLYNLLLQAPNKNNTAFDLQQSAMVDMGLGGNFYARIRRNGGGVIEALEPLEPHKVVIKQNTETGRIFYDVEGWGTNIPHTEVWRMNGLSADGLVGMPPVNLMRDAIGIAVAGEQRAGAMHKNGALPSGIVTTSEGLSPEALETLRNEFRKAYSGTGGSGATIFLDAGMEFNPLSMDAEKSQFIASRKFQIIEIARQYRVPPHMIGDLERATFSNIESQSLEFVIYTLGPWIRRIEQTITRDLLTETEKKGYFAKFNVEGLLRGDFKTRMEGYASAITNGWLNRNEVRELEDRNTVAGLDDYLTPLNMTKGDDDA